MSPSSGSALSAKLSTGPVSGVELQEIDRVMLPRDIENIFGHYGDCEIDPPECLTTGLGSPGAAPQAKGEVATTTVMLGSDASFPGKHREYAQRYPSASGTVGSTPFTMNVELLPEPNIEGTSDVVTTTTIWHDDGVGTTGITPRLIVVGGNIDSIDVVVRAHLPSDDPGSFVRVTKETFRAQVKKLSS